MNIATTLQQFRAVMPEMSLKWWLEFFTSLATIFTAIVACRALRTWKEQIIANRHLDLHSRIINVISEWEIFTIELVVENQDSRKNREQPPESHAEQLLINRETINKNTLKLQALKTTIKYGTKSCENHETLLKEIQVAIEIQNEILRTVKRCSTLSTSKEDFPLKNVREQMETIAKASMYLIPKI